MSNETEFSLPIGFLFKIKTTSGIEQGTPALIKPSLIVILITK